MHDELLEGAVCAGSDLTARLLAELTRAIDCLALAQARVHAAAAAGIAPSSLLREQAKTCRHHVRSLQHVLSGMPDFGGSDRAASA